MSVAPLETSPLHCKSFKSETAPCSHTKKELWKSSLGVGVVGATFLHQSGSPPALLTFIPHNFPFVPNSIHKQLVTNDVMKKSVTIQSRPGHGSRPENWYGNLTGLDGVRSIPTLPCLPKSSPLNWVGLLAVPAAAARFWARRARAGWREEVQLGEEKKKEGRRRRRWQRQHRAEARVMVDAGGWKGRRKRDDGWVVGRNQTDRATGCVEKHAKVRTLISDPSPRPSDLSEWPLVSTIVLVKCKCNPKHPQGGENWQFKVRKFFPRVVVLEKQQATAPSVVVFPYVQANLDQLTNHWYQWSPIEKRSASDQLLDLFRQLGSQDSFHWAWRLSFVRSLFFISCCCCW